MADARIPNVGQVELVAELVTTGSLVPGATMTGPGSLDIARRTARPNPRSQPNRPGAIFRRTDSPFVSDEGTHVSLTAEPGLTPRGLLDVPFRFQIPPMDSWQRSFTGRMTPFDIVGGTAGPKERSRRAGPGLRSVSFRTMFLDWQPTWQVWDPDVLEPVLAVRELERLARRNVVFNLKLRNRGMFDYDDVNMLAVITQGDVEEVAGEPDTRYVTLTFQEYDELDIERQTRAAKQNGGPWTHTIKDGDTLHALARRYYHEVSQWGVIAASNPNLASWAPSRNLMEYATRYHRPRLRIPAKPVTTASRVAGTGRPGLGANTLGGGG